MSTFAQEQIDKLAKELEQSREEAAELRLIVEDLKSWESEEAASRAMDAGCECLPSEVCAWNRENMTYFAENKRLKAEVERLKNRCCICGKPSGTNLSWRDYGLVRCEDCRQERGVLAKENADLKAQLDRLLLYPRTCCCEGCGKLVHADDAEGWERTYDDSREQRWCKDCTKPLDVEKLKQKFDEEPGGDKAPPASVGEAPFHHYDQVPFETLADVGLQSDISRVEVANNPVYKSSLVSHIGPLEIETWIRGSKYCNNVPDERALRNLLLSRLTPDQKRELFHELAGELLPEVTRDGSILGVEEGCRFDEWVVPAPEGKFVVYGSDFHDGYQPMDRSQMLGLVACCLAAELERGQADG